MLTGQLFRMTSVPEFGYDEENIPRCTLVHSLQDGLINHEIAYDITSEMEPPFKVLAGQIACELAYWNTQRDLPQAADDWLKKAGEMYTVAERESGCGSHEARLTTCLARLNLIHLDTLVPFITERRLPDWQLASSVYQRLINEGVSLRQLGHEIEESNGGQTEITGDIVGIQSEVAVLALCHRIAIRELQPDTWFAYASFLSQDLANPRHSKVNHSWDASIYTAFDREVPKLIYKAEIESSPNASRHDSDDEDIVRIRLSPDLSLDEQEGAKLTAGRILAGCVVEERAGGYHPVITKQLDDRTYNLLEKLDDN